MKSRWIPCLVLTSFLSVLFVSTTHAKDPVLEGRIVDYQCGDNCYLTIVNARKKQKTGLCAAAVCQKWNEIEKMPLTFKGRKVRITVGKGVQYDGGSRVMGHMDAFEKIEFLK